MVLPEWWGGAGPRERGFPGLRSGGRAQVTVFLGMREVPWGQVAAFLAVWRGREPRDFVFPGQWRRSGPQDFFSGLWSRSWPEDFLFPGPGRRPARQVFPFPAVPMGGARREKANQPLAMRVLRWDDAIGLDDPNARWGGFFLRAGAGRSGLRGAGIAPTCRPSVIEERKTHHELECHP